MKMVILSHSMMIIVVTWCAKRRKAVRRPFYTHIMCTMMLVICATLYHLYQRCQLLLLCPHRFLKQMQYLTTFFTVTTMMAGIGSRKKKCPEKDGNTMCTTD